MSRSSLSSNLRHLRHMSHFSQEEIAEHIGVSRNMYVRYESGESEPPVDKLDSLAKLFGVSIAALTNSDMSISTSASHYGFEFLGGMSDLICSFEDLSAISRKIIMDEIRLLQEIESGLYNID